MIDIGFSASNGRSTYKGTPLIDYGNTEVESAYGNPNDALGQAGNRFQNFMQGAAKAAPLATSLAFIPVAGPALAALTAVGGGIWNAFAAEDTQNKAREAEIEGARRARQAYLSGKQFLTDQEKEQLALFDRQIKTLEQNYENQKALQASILARQQQAAQFGYGGALGATGMSYAAAQPGLMRGLAARGMLGTGAEAAARAGLAGQRAAAIERAAQTYSDTLSQAYQADARTRSGLLDALSTNQAAIDANRTNFNRRMAEAQFNLQQGNIQAAYNQIDQARKNVAESQQQRGSDIFKGIVDVAGSSAFQSAMGAAFGPASTGAAPAGGLVKPPMPTPDFSAPTVGPTTNAPTAGLAPGKTLYSGESVDELQRNISGSRAYDSLIGYVPQFTSSGIAVKSGSQMSGEVERLPAQLGGTQIGIREPRLQETRGIPGLSNKRITNEISSPYKSLGEQTSQMLQLPKPKPRGGLLNTNISTNLSYGG